MGRRKKDDNGKRVDPRNRKTVMATIDLDTDEGELIDSVYKGIKANGFGLSGWKQFVTNALALYAGLLNHDFESLGKLFPEIDKAIALFHSIEGGNLMVMKIMFPERYRVFRLELEADILENMNHDNQRDLLKELRSIKEELEALKNSGIQAPANNGGIKQIGTLKAVADPVFDDDEDLLGVKKDEKAGERAALNFIASIKRL